MANKKWTKEEDDFIRQNSNMSNAEVGQYLKRSETAINSRRSFIGEKKTVSWSEEEMAFLKNNTNLSYKELEKELGKSYNNIRYMVDNLGLKLKGNVWTDKQKQVILDNYGKIPFREIGEKIGKSAKSVKHMAAKLLGTGHIISYSSWTKPEDDFLRSNSHLDNEEMSRFINKTSSQIKTRKSKLGIVWDRSLSCSEKIFVARFFEIMDIELLVEYIDKPKTYIITEAEKLGYSTNDRNYLEYNNWRSDVFRRDNFLCKICSSKASVVHHLNGYHWDIENRLNPNNAISLCDNCHSEFHKLFGRKHNTKEQFLDYLDNYIFVPPPIIDGINWR